MTVLMFVHGGGIGGATLSLLQQVRLMDMTRFRVIAVFLQSTPLMSQYAAAGVECEMANGISYFSHTTGESVRWQTPRSFMQLMAFLPSFIRCLRILDRIRPDVVHANSSTLLAVVLAARAKSIPVVWYIREHVVSGIVGLRRWLHHMAARRLATSTIFILEAERARFRFPNQSEVIYNYVDSSAFSPIESRAVPAIKRPRVAMVGSVTRIKGVLEFIRSFPVVHAVIPDVSFVVIGYNSSVASRSAGVSPWWNRLQKWMRARAGTRYADEVDDAISLLPPDSIEFTGPTMDMPGVLRNVDVLVVPSIEPHFARPAVEAGAMGIPVIASDIEGPDEIVVHGKTGLLVPPGDPYALGHAIVSVLGDSELGRSMGSAAVERVRRLFDAKTNSSRVIAIYERIHEDSLRMKLDGTHNPSKLGMIAALVWVGVVYAMYVFKSVIPPERWQDLFSLFSV